MRVPPRFTNSTSPSLPRASATVPTPDPTQAEADRVHALKLLKEAQTEHDLADAKAALDVSLVRIQASGHPGGHGY